MRKQRDDNQSNQITLTIQRCFATVQTLRNSKWMSCFALYLWVGLICAIRAHVKISNKRNILLNFMHSIH